MKNIRKKEGLRAAMPIKRAAMPIRRAAMPIKRAAMPMGRAAMPMKARSYADGYFKIYQLCSGRCFLYVISKKHEKNHIFIANMTPKTRSYADEIGDEGAQLCRCKNRGKNGEKRWFFDQKIDKNRVNLIKK
jgi:hypothetical protein